MELYLDQDACIGCGLCGSIVPEVFRMNDNGICEMLDRRESSEPRIEEAIESCPVTCIHWR